MGDVHISPSNGVDAGYNGGDPTILRSMTAFAAISWYNAIELIILILYVFKKYEGAYFWSLLVTSFVIIIYQFGAWSKQVGLDIPHLVPVAFINIGWMILIPGESLVLWSRLHLVTQNQTLLRFVLWLIFIDFILFGIPTTVTTWGANIEFGLHDNFVVAYGIVEKIQLTAFSAQEIFISGIYLWEVQKIYRAVFEGRTRRIMWELAVINVIIICLDIAMLVLEYQNFYQIQTTMKGMIYSIKLKLEFGVLSKLINVITDRHSSRFFTGDDNLVDATRMPGYQEPAKQIDYSTTQGGSGFSGFQHIEMIHGDDNLPPEWRRGSSVSPAILGSPLPERCQCASRRSSHSEISYPGRLA